MDDLLLLLSGGVWSNEHYYSLKMAGALYKRRERSLDRLERSPSFPGMMMNPIMPFVVCVFLSRGAQKPLSFLSLSLEQQQREKKVESNTLETKSSSSLSLSFLQTTDVITERIIIIIRRKCRHRFRTLHRPLPCRTRRPRTRQGLSLIHISEPTRPY